MIGFSLTAPARTIFGRGSCAGAPDEICALGDRVLIVRGRSVGWVDDLIAALSKAGRAVETVYSAGEPDLDAVRQAVSVARRHKADCIAAIGGGAAIDLGKAISGLSVSPGDPVDYLELGNASAARLNDPLPFVAIPTTAGTGAEATRNAVIGVPERQAKISLRDFRLVPALAIVDPALTDGAPKPLTLATGLDAITQLIESYLCNRATLVTDALCRSAVPDAVAALAKLMRTEDAEARDAMARASYLSGLALANSGLGVVHGLASVIGGRGGAHGAICGRLLAPSLAVNARAAQERGRDMPRFEQVGRWLARGLDRDNGNGIRALSDFVNANGLPSLGELGVRPSDHSAIAAQAISASSTRANPIELSVTEIEAILGAADGPGDE